MSAMLDTMETRFPNLVAKATPAIHTTGPMGSVETG